MGLFSRTFKGRARYDYLYRAPEHNPWDEVHCSMEWLNEVPDFDDCSSVIHHDISANDSDSNSNSDKKPPLHKRISNSILSPVISEKERIAKKYKEWSDQRKIAKWIAQGWPNPADGFDQTQYQARPSNRGEPASIIRYVVLRSPYHGTWKEGLPRYYDPPSKW
jgi:hypothetical protein